MKGRRGRRYMRVKGCEESITEDGEGREWGGGGEGEMYNIIIGLAEYVQNFTQIYKTLAGALTRACMFISPSQSV